MDLEDGIGFDMIMLLNGLVSIVLYFLDVSTVVAADVVGAVDPPCNCRRGT